MERQICKDKDIPFDENAFLLKEFSSEEIRIIKAGIAVRTDTSSKTMTVGESTIMMKDLVTSHIPTIGAEATVSHSPLINLSANPSILEKEKSPTPTTSASILKSDDRTMTQVGITLQTFIEIGLLEFDLITSPEFQTFISSLNTELILQTTPS